MLLSVTQDLRTMTILTWKVKYSTKLHAVLENSMRQKKIFKHFSLFCFKDFCKDFFFLFLLHMKEDLTQSIGTQKDY